MIGDLVRQVEARGPFDLIHVHPGRARKFGLHLADRNDVPMVMTFHGAWFDSIYLYHRRLQRIFAVSEAVRDGLADVLPASSVKTQLMYNAVTRAAIPQKRKRIADRFTVVVASRFDADKRSVTDYLMELWQLQAARRCDTLYWNIAGEGRDVPALKTAAAQLEEALGQSLVSFHGWLSPEQLRGLYQRAAVAICPGRSALETMAAGLPTVALGSKGCVGLVDGDRFETAKYCNFGGYGLSAPVAPATVLDDLIELRDDASRWEELSLKSQQWMTAHFNGDYWNRELWRAYRDVLELESN